MYADTGIATDSARLRVVRSMGTLAGKVRPPLVCRPADAGIAGATAYNPQFQCGQIATG